MNSTGVFNTSKIPTILFPEEARFNHPVQQVGTQGEHLRGGSQYENATVVVPPNSTFQILDSQRNIQIEGGDKIFLPAIQTRSGGMGVTPGFTFIHLITDPRATQPSTLSVPPFQPGALIVTPPNKEQKSITLPVGKAFVAKAQLNTNGNVPEWFMESNSEDVQ